MLHRKICVNDGYGISKVVILILHTILCVWWDEWCMVYYELLKPGETIDTKHYQQQLTNFNHLLLEKRPEYQKRQHKVIYFHDNAPSHGKTGL